MVAAVFGAPSAFAQSKLPETPSATPDTEDEIVEIVVDDEAAPKAAARPEAPKGKADKIELRGFGRTTAVVGLSSEGSAPAAGAKEERVGYERGASVSQAYLDVRYTRGKGFQAVISGSLAYTGVLLEGGAGQDIAALEQRTVLLEPVLREAYLGFYSERVDLRLGQQRIVWGNSDGAAPNDVLNARDTRNRIQLDPEMVQLPTLAARADFDLGIAVLGLVAQPFFTPDRAPIYGTNWSLVQPDAPRYVRKFFGTYARDKSPSEIENALISTRPNEGAFDGASIGSSLRFHFGSFDASFYYHYGRDRSPFVYLDPLVAQQIDSLKSDSNPNGQEFEVFYGFQKRAAAAYGGPLVVESVRRHHVGADLATTAGPFVLRVDTAFDTAMTFYTRQNLNSVARPTAQAVLGAEYQRGLGKVILVEASYMRLLGPEVPVVPVANQANDGALLFVDENNLGIANVVRWTFGDNVVVEARSFLGVQPLSWVLRPELGWQTPSFTIRLGYVAIDGAGGSFGSYYRRNESLYLTTRYSF